MSNFKDSLRNLDPDLMYEIAINLGSRTHSPDGEDSVNKVGQYPAFDSITVALNRRFQANPNLDPAERQLLVLGVFTCLEALADYANAEEMRDSVLGR